MSAIDRVRAKFSNAYVENQQKQQKPFAGSAASSHTHSETHGHPSAGSAGSPHRDSEKLRPAQPVQCQDCRHFDPRSGQQPDGFCGKFATETWSAVPFACDGFERSEASRRLEARRRKVEAQLRADPKLRIAADVADAPLRPEPGRPVSIVLAVRTTAGLVSGELQAPRERFDTGVFITYLKQIPEIPS